MAGGRFRGRTTVRCGSWDLTGSGQPRAGPARERVSSVALTSDGRWAVSGSDDGAVRLWDLQGQDSRELGRHGSRVISLALTSDGRWAVSGSSDGAVRLWDLQGQQSRELGRHEGSVRSVALHRMAGGRYRGRTTVRCGCGIYRVRRAASWAGTGAGSGRWR